MSEHDLPSATEIRARIDAVKDEVYRNALRYQYLICGRVSEVVGKYAPLGSHFTITDFDGVEAVLFAVRTAKRKNNPLRPAALPLDPKYEPWAETLAEWFENRGDEKAFPCSTRSLQYAASESFAGLYYPIEEYKRAVQMYVDGELRPLVVVGEDGKERRVWDVVYSHWRPMCTHALRHTRAFQDLMVNYGFSGLDLAIYGGWTSRVAEQQLPAPARKYLHLAPDRVNLSLLKRLASRYFPKLLKRSGGFWPGWTVRTG